MKLIDEYILEVNNELRIQKGYTETTDNWICRIIYSILGRMAFASLFDQKSTPETTSIIYFKNQLKKNLRTLTLVFPNSTISFQTNFDAVVDEVLKQFIDLGMVYRSPNNITLAKYQQISYNQISFIRGFSFSSNYFASGLGHFFINQPNTENMDVIDFFQLQRIYTLDELIRDYTLDSWHEMNDTSNIEFLNTVPPFYKGYWATHPEKDGSISILRKKYDFTTYFFYKYVDNILYVHKVPNWLSHEKEYIRLAYPILHNKSCFPNIRYIDDGKIVIINFDYLLPPSELNLIKLYSWPFDFSNISDDFSRVMNRNIFYVFKEIYESIGYIFKEDR